MLPEKLINNYYCKTKSVQRIIRFMFVNFVGAKCEEI